MTESKLFKINRFGSGVHEGCSTGLFFPTENHIDCDQKSEISATVIFIINSL